VLPVTALCQINSLTFLLRSADLLCVDDVTSLVNSATALHVAVMIVYAQLSERQNICERSGARRKSGGAERWGGVAENDGVGAKLGVGGRQ